MKAKLLVLLAMAPAMAFAQGSQQMDPVINSQFGYVREMPMREANTTGSVYLNDDWKNGTVVLKKAAKGVESLFDITIKLDLKSNVFDVQIDSKIRVLNGSKVKSFSWTNAFQTTDTFVNCDAYTLDGARLAGFGRILNKDTTGLMLIEYNYIELVKSNYNVALHVGSRENKYVKRSKLYVIKGDTILPANKNSLMDTMANKEEAVKKFIKDNDINLKNESSMAAVIDYYNSLG